MTPFSDHVYRSGKYAEKVEQYNRDVQEFMRALDEFNERGKNQIDLSDVVAEQTKTEK